MIAMKAQALHPELELGNRPRTFENRLAYSNSLHWGFRFGTGSIVLTIFFPSVMGRIINRILWGYGIRGVVC